MGSQEVRWGRGGQVGSGEVSKSIGEVGQCDTAENQTGPDKKWRCGG